MYKGYRTKDGLMWALKEAGWKIGTLLYYQQCAAIPAGGRKSELILIKGFKRKQNGLWMLSVEVHILFPEPSTHSEMWDIAAINTVANSLLYKAYST